MVLSYHELYKHAKLIDNSTGNENTQHFLSTRQTFALHCGTRRLRMTYQYCISSLDLLTHFTLARTV